MARQETPSAKDALILNAVTPNLLETPKHVELDNTYCSVLYYCDFKTENDVGWADVLFNQRNMPVCIRMDPASGSAIKESVDLHEKQTIDSLLSRNKTASQIDDLEREQRHGHEILQYLGDQNEKFFMTSISSVLRASTEEELQSEMAYYRSAVQAQGMDFKDINHNHLTGLLAASPLRCPDRSGTEQTVRPFTAGTLGHALFTKEVGLDDGRGIDLGIDDMDGIVRLNIVDRTPTRHNSNIVIVGGSGSGKSTLAKKLALMESVMYGSKIIILDPENEFSDLVHSLGGEVVTIGGSSSAKISPLQPRALVSDSETDKRRSNGEAAAEDVDDDYAASREYVLLSTIPFAKNFLSLAFNIHAEYLDLLEVGLEHAYSKYGITTQTTFKEYFDRELSYPIMRDLYDSLTTLATQYKDGTYEAQFNRIALSIRTAANGIYADVWNSRSSFSIDSDIVSFNLIDMEDDDRMRAAWYYNILTWAWSEIRMAPSTGKPVRVIIDEAHNCVNPRFPAVADDVKSMVKRIRKRGGGTTIITQEINDLLDSKIKLQGAAILNNATYKFIGQAEAENLQELAKLYGMPNELVNRIRKASKGNFACFAGTQDRTWVKVRIEPWMDDMFGQGGGL